MGSEAQLREGWNILTGFGVLGIIASLLVALAAAVVFWAIRMLNKHGEGIVLSVKNAFDSVPTIIDSVTANTNATKELAETFKSNLDVIQGQFDHQGVKYIDHVFSSDRVERAWLEGLVVLEFWASQLSDPHTKATFQTCIHRMQRILQRKLGETGERS